MKSKITLIIVLGVIVFGAIAWWLFSNEKVSLQHEEWKIKDTETFTPDREADQKFGFLIGPSADEMKLARETGAGWVRPHPGPFVWREMQSSATDTIDFSQTDSMVRAAAQYDINILPTIWHFAEWDQKANPDASDCIVSGHEFRSEFGKYRCNPYDWDAYSEWVSAIVERYDGDGVDDMPDLQNPITHWEVMNEPDIRPMEGEDGLQFFIGEPADYAELLKKTSSAIRAAHPGAQVVIAGAAGGDDFFLDYFREVFKDTETHDAFDIANVHCISGGDIDSFNTKPYSEMLAEFRIDKPIWVTEAEAFESKDPKDGPIYDIGKQLLKSSTNAIANGATKIFFTSMNIDNRPGGDIKDEPKRDDNKKKAGPQASEEVYQPIFDTL